MAKGAREKIRLVSTAGTGYFYTTTKNKRTMPEKMEIKKFDPKVRQHVVFKEAKIKQSIVWQHPSRMPSASFLCCLREPLRPGHA